MLQVICKLCYLTFFRTWDRSNHNRADTKYCVTEIDISDGCYLFINTILWFLRISIWSLVVIKNIPIVMMIKTYRYTHELFNVRVVVNCARQYRCDTRSNRAGVWFECSQREILKLIRLKNNFKEEVQRILPPSQPLAAPNETTPTMIWSLPSFMTNGEPLSPKINAF